jgi:hypothetical protein
MGPCLALSRHSNCSASRRKIFHYAEDDSVQGMEQVQEPGYAAKCLSMAKLCSGEGSGAEMCS